MSQDQFAGITFQNMLTDLLRFTEGPRYPTFYPPFSPKTVQNTQHLYRFHLKQAVNLRTKLSPTNQALVKSKIGEIAHLNSEERSIVLTKWIINTPIIGHLKAFWQTGQDPFNFAIHPHLSQTDEMVTKEKHYTYAWVTLPILDLETLDQENTFNKFPDRTLTVSYTHLTLPTILLV